VSTSFIIFRMGTKKCQKCENHFEWYPSWKNRKTCSIECSNKLGTKKNSGRTRFKKGSIPWNKDLKMSNEFKINHSKKMKKAWKTNKNLHNRKIKYKETAKKISATRQGVSIEDWGGFVRIKQYKTEFYNKRDFIKKRDNYTCRECGTKNPKLCFDIHHIDFDKNNNSINNLITLCHSCHSKITNKKYWINHYQNKIKLEKEDNMTKNMEAIANVS